MIFFLHIYQKTDKGWIQSGSSLSAAEDSTGILLLRPFYRVFVRRGVTNESLAESCSYKKKSPS
jgi:hypothetical protein